MNTLVQSANRQDTRALARAVVGLFKLRIGFMIMLTALVGMAFAPGPALPPDKIVLLALCVLTSSAAAGAFNQYYEWQSDRLMARTRNRAFVTGALPHTRWWLALIVAMTLGSAALAAVSLNVPAASYIFLGGFFYAVVYTVWLKRRTAYNIVVGGLAGSFAVLGGAAAVDPGLGPLPWLLATVLFLWTPPHFWALAIAGHDEYKAAGVPMLPVVVGIERASQTVLLSTIALVAVSLLPVFFGAGLIYFTLAALGGAWFIAKSIRLARMPNRLNAMAAFFASLVQLSLLLAGATLDSLLR